MSDNTRIRGTYIDELPLDPKLWVKCKWCQNPIENCDTPGFVRCNNENWSCYKYCTKNGLGWPPKIDS